MKKFKKTAVFLLAFMLISNNVFASTLKTNSKERTSTISVQTEILEDNDSIRVAQAVDDGKIYTSTFDKKQNTLLNEVRDQQSNTLIQSSLLDLNTQTNSVSKFNSDGMVAYSSRYVIAEENTFSNFEYTEYSDESWQIRRPREPWGVNWYYFNTTETSSNRSYLTNFKNKVELINSLEWKVAGCISGMTILTYVTICLGATGFGAGVAVAPALAAAGCGAAAISYSFDLVEAQEDAYYYYNKVKLNS